METNNIPTANVGVDLDNLEEKNHSSVLVVDDEAETVLLIKAILRMAGFNVLSAMNGEEAIKKLSSFAPDLVMLDIMMPEMDGWETLQYMRQMSDVPVIVVSAQNTKEDVVNGLQRGVDDYITKPFHNEEVVERVKSVLRRARKVREVSKLVFPAVDLTVDLMTREVCLGGQSIRLTSKEFAVLSILAKHAPSIVTYQTIAESIWGEDSEDARKRIKYLAYLLRRKFEKIAPQHDLIVNIDRLGYQLQTEG
ncbi:MAG: response regulator transcription factor [Anaerolineae bacterium]|nr:response regulator transcription factor [Anaerolineae bacterium]